ncbi:hypothetical protein [Actinomadura chokoriensis]|uniref:Uncharacterized protein n=1 Tax=Actinomadura chokoriensis TaxID=454156 RepID=A0ABV4QQC7_9ACTN
MANLPCPTPATQMSAATQQTLTQLRSEYAAWTIGYTPGDTHPWHATRDDATAMVRAATPAALRGRIRTADWREDADR